MKVSKLLLSAFILITFFMVEPVNAQRTDNDLSVGYRGLGESDLFGLP